MTEFTIKDVANIIKDTAKIREKSFDHEAADEAEKTQPTGFIDFAVFYTKTLAQASEEACKEHGVDSNFARLIYLALDGWWNDTLDLADTILKE